ncbi:MAG TPA: sulfatase/phosphatase domain-containing protein, partial [Thermoguttaceae bacterium]|nr:sulfatase/phosphatase domain-containing protein [Thermoguttaceae bacterium]
IVIFFSDNGGGGGSDNWPLKGHKGWMFEGGIRVPCIVRYPGRIPAGTVCDELLTSLEIVPTLLAEANIRPPSELVLDGYNMMPTLAEGKPSPRTEMFWQRKQDKAARVGNWKWVESDRGNGLFDLSTDVGEKNDLSDAFPEKLAELKEAFARWKARMAAAEPRGPFRDY